MINVIILYNITLFKWSYDNNWSFTSKKQLCWFRMTSSSQRKNLWVHFSLVTWRIYPTTLTFGPAITGVQNLLSYSRAMYRKLSFYRTDVHLSNHDKQQWRIIAIVIFNSIQDSEFLHGRGRGRGGQWGVGKSHCHSHDFEIWSFLCLWKLF